MSIGALSRKRLITSWLRQGGTTGEVAAKTSLRAATPFTGPRESTLRYVGILTVLEMSIGGLFHLRQNAPLRAAFYVKRDLG